MIKKKKAKKIGEKIFFWSILVLPLLQFCVFYIGVNFNSILLSLASFNSSSDGCVTKIKSVFPFIKLTYALCVFE